MHEKLHSLRTRLTVLLLALICVLGLFPTTAFAARDTITLKEFLSASRENKRFPLDFPQ